MLTDKGKSFTDRFTRANECKPNGRHHFEQESQAHGIEHRLKSERPQTHDMIERFNEHLTDVLAIRRYTSGAEAQAILLAVQSPYPTESPASSIADHRDEGMADQAA